ncbi:MAG: CoA-disulfide reductase [Chloroflexi bacterium]|nr:CoA-disulfide reductase [Chloroflexota bacterium]
MAKKQRVVIVGAVAAGTSAAAKAKRVNPDLEVILLERDPHISYGACGLPYFIAGLIPSAEALIARSPAEFQKQGIEVRIRHEVREISPRETSLLVTDHERAKEYRLSYDYLVLATGAISFRPPVQGLDLSGVFTLRTLSDGLALSEALRRKRPSNVVIVGGGYIGLEMAEAFRALDLPVTIVEMAPQLMVNLGEDMSKLVLAEVERHGVRVLLNDGLVRCEGTYHVEKVVTQHNEIPADLVLLAIGVRPNVQLAERAGIQLGAGKAIAVDSHMRTHIEGIYAAGDCADAKHGVTGERTYIPLGTTANKQGRVAGANIAGMDCTFEGVVGTAVAKIFDLEVARTGLTEKEAAAKGFSVHAVTVRTTDRARYYPGATDLHVKLIMDRTTRRLLGAQYIGAQGAAKRIDVLAAALYAQMTVDDLTRLDYSYAPPYASVWDATLIAANVASRCS